METIEIDKRIWWAILKLYWWNKHQKEINTTTPLSSKEKNTCYITN